MNSSAPFRPAGSLDAGSALAPYNGPWDNRRAAHLLRRAGFGGSPSDVERVARMRMSEAVDSFVQFPQTTSLPDQPEDLPDWSEYLRTLRGLLTGAIAPDAVIQMETSAPSVAGVPVTAPSPDPAVRPVDLARRTLTRRYIVGSLVSLQRWFLTRMLQTPAPLQERMVLFWHGHFTSALLDKGTSPPDMVAQNNLFRRYALGNIHQLTQAVARDPAMMRYLDNFRNEKEHPNENFARELMELFTLGIGNYTEQDIRESARAFTGWTLRRDEFYENPAKHDDGRKAFLGRTGNFDGGDIIDIIFEQPTAARWFAHKLLTHFVYSDPEPALVEATAALIRKNDYNLQPVMSTLLRSRVFYSDRSYRALVKSPIEFVVGTYQLFGVQSIPMEAINGLRQMGQLLFNPPNVKGWDGGIAWLNSQTLLTRENFASALVASQEMPQDSWLVNGMPLNAREAAQRLIGTILQGDASEASLASLIAYLDGSESATNGRFSGENFPERIRGAAYLAMAMPAYQLA